MGAGVRFVRPLEEVWLLEGKDEGGAACGLTRGGGSVANSQHRERGAGEAPIERRPDSF